MPDDVDISSAITSATDEAVAEVGGLPGTTKDEAPEEVQSEETQEAASEGTEEETTAEKEPKAEAEAEEEEPLGLSAAQLEAINKNPELQAVYKSMQRGFTKKTQTLAETRKQFEEAARMVDYIRANPDRAVEEMAQMRGYILAKKDAGQARQTEVQEAASDAVDALMEKYSKQLGPESTKLLLPMMKDVAKAVAEQALGPIAQQTQFLDQAAKQRGIAAAVHEFGSTVKEQGEEWDDSIQADMAQMMDRVVPAENTTLPDYLKAVYDAVTANRSRTKAVRSQLARLKKAQAEAEPTRAVRPGPKVEQQITADMSERDAISLATALAEKEARAS